MADVVSPRGVTYNVTCHQWFSGGPSSILTLPTICVHRCKVSRVSRHASNGRTGQLSARSVCCVMIFSFARYLLLSGLECCPACHPFASLKGCHPERELWI